MAIASLVPIVIISAIAINQQHNRLMEQRKQFQESVLQVTMNGMLMFMRGNHCSQIPTSLQGIRKDTKIQEIRILDNFGSVRFSSNQNEIGKMDTDIHLFAVEGSFPKTNQYASVNKKTNELTITKRIPKEQQCMVCHTDSRDYIGYISIVGDLSDVKNEAMIHLRYDVIISVGLIITLTITISLVHLRFVQGNIKLLNEAIQEVEHGNFEKHIPIDESKEMGTLAVSFNQMIDHLNEMRNELRTAHKKDLERAEKLANVGELAASMAHEIKNPVAGISGAMNVLLHESEDSNPNKPIFEEILVQTQRIDRAVNSLLAYSRPRAPVFTECHLDELVQKSSQLILQSAKHTNIEAKLELNPDTPTSLVDCEQIQQVLVNLILNAIQAMPNGGRLTIQQDYLSQDNQIQLKVSDTGIGIEKAKQKDIFKPFYTTKPNGTGLGLAICKNIIEQHLGTIEVESEVNQGTTFIIKLPIRPPTPASLS